MKISAPNIVLLLLMLLSAAMASALRPTISLADERPPISLKAMVPTAFGDWQEQLLNSAQIIDPQTKQKLDAIYSETLTRTYVNSKGYQIMLSIAYGRNQSDALQMHKPEVCYPAQGFVLQEKRAGTLDLGAVIIPATRLMTTLQQRREPVTYWTVVGDHVSSSGLDKKLTEMKYALQNRIPDGMLIRVSSIDGNMPRAHQFQHQFAVEMVAAINPANRHRFAGAPDAASGTPQVR